VYGDSYNLLAPTSAVFNIGLRSLHRALQHYSCLPSDHDTLTAQYAKSGT
ncbi:hypothetical protein B484DRAFT_412468, partial [Ochromonadaceae sp. CCMP2298]